MIRGRTATITGWFLLGLGAGLTLARVVSDAC